MLSIRCALPCLMWALTLARVPSSAPAAASSLLMAELCSSSLQPCQCLALDRRRQHLVLSAQVLMGAFCVPCVVLAWRRVKSCATYAEQQARCSC